MPGVAPVNTNTFDRSVHVQYRAQIQRILQMVHP